MTEDMDSLFSDPLVDRIRENAGIFTAGRVTIHLPRVFGFCGGVTRAVGLLRAELGAGTGRAIWLLGPIIHNDAVNSWFEEQGVHIVPEGALDTCFASAAASDCFVIPAFGLPLGIQKQLCDFVGPEGRIVDTTCPYVARIWDFVQSWAQRGKTIVIHGKPGHPETKGILSRSLTAENAAILVPDPAHARRLVDALRQGDARGYPAEFCFHQTTIRLTELASVSQTTMLYSETEEIEGMLSQAVLASGGHLKKMNSVCRATQQRQDAAKELCHSDWDVSLILGGFNSSNTNRLYSMAGDAGPSYFIRDAAAIEKRCIRHYDPVRGQEVSTKNWRPEGPAAIALLAGASCPDRIIGDVIRRLLDLTPHG